MSQAQPDTESIDLPKPTATVAHPKDLRTTARALATRLDNTYDNNDGVEVSSITEERNHYKHDARIAFPEGTVVSSSTVEDALADSPYSLRGFLAYSNGKIEVELVRDTDEDDE